MPKVLKALPAKKRQRPNLDVMPLMISREVSAPADPGVREQQLQQQQQRHRQQHDQNPQTTDYTMDMHEARPQHLTPTLLDPDASKATAGSPASEMAMSDMASTATVVSDSDSGFGCGASDASEGDAGSTCSHTPPPVEALEPFAPVDFGFGTLLVEHEAALRFPRLFVRLRKQPIDMAKIQRLLAAVDDFMSRNQPFTVVFDMRGCTLPSRPHINAIGAWARAHGGFSGDGSLDRLLQGSVVLLTSVMVRSTINMILAMAKPAQPVGIFASEVDAFVFARDKCWELRDWSVAGIAAYKAAAKRQRPAGHRRFGGRRVGADAWESPDGAAGSTQPYAPVGNRSLKPASPRQAPRPPLRSEGAPMAVGQPPHPSGQHDGSAPEAKADGEYKPALVGSPILAVVPDSPPRARTQVSPARRPVFPSPRRTATRASQELTLEEKQTPAGGRGLKSKPRSSRGFLARLACCCGGPGALEGDRTRHAENMPWCDAEAGPAALSSDPSQPQAEASPGRSPAYNLRPDDTL